jgi:dTDP-4-dehydrorhamnose reductase
MRIVVTGAGGQLGIELVESARSRGHEVAGFTRQQLDVVDADAVVAAFRQVRPDVVVHAAAWTAVDACEADPGRAFLINARGTRNVVDATRAVSARVIYISTDYVFDGSQHEAYDVDDAPNPRSVYGASKLAGEEACTDDDLIVRISWVCGYHGANMVKTIMRLAGGHDELHFVDDQVGSPTFADDAAATIIQLAECAAGGVVHVTNSGVTSWYGFAGEVLEAMGLDRTRVKPITTAELQPPRPAERPQNSVLANRSLVATGIDPLPDYRESLRRLVRRLLDDAQG